jgi:hypothetical protein
MASVLVTQLDFYIRHWATPRAEKEVNSKYHENFGWNWKERKTGTAKIIKDMYTIFLLYTCTSHLSITKVCHGLREERGSPKRI